MRSSLAPKVIKRLNAKLSNTGLGVIKLEFIFRHKIKRNDWLLADTCFILSLSLYALSL